MSGTTHNILDPSNTYSIGGGEFRSSTWKDRTVEVGSLTLRSLVEKLRDTHSPPRIDEIQDQIMEQPDRDRTVEYLLSCVRRIESARVSAALLEVAAAIDPAKCKPLLIDVLETAADARLREVAVEALGSLVSADDVRQALTNAAQQDVSPVVRETAHELLEED